MSVVAWVVRHGAYPNSVTSHCQDFLDGAPSPLHTRSTPRTEAGRADRVRGGPAQHKESAHMRRIVAAILLVAVLAIGGGHHRHHRLPGRARRRRSPRPPPATAPCTPVVVPAYGVGYGWHPFGFGFGFLGFLGALFFLFLVFGLIRAIVCGGRHATGAGPAGDPAGRRARADLAARAPGRQPLRALGGRPPPGLRRLAPRGPRPGRRPGVRPPPTRHRRDRHDTPRPRPADLPSQRPRAIDPGAHPSPPPHYDAPDANRPRRRRRTQDRPARPRLPRARRASRC